MNYKIAYIDENDGWLNTFYHTLKNDFEILRIKVDSFSTVTSIVDQLFKDDLDAIITDYLLEEEADVNFNGNKIIESIRLSKPHFPVIMLTSHEPQAINHMDDVHIIYGKSILDGESEDELDLFKIKIKSNIDNYYLKIENTRIRIEKLIEKRNNETLNNDEEEILTKLYMLMDELDPEAKGMPSSLIQPASISRLNEFVEDTKNILAELKKLNSNAQL